MKRRIVALLLALVMALGLALPASATDAAPVGGDGGSDIVIGGGADESTSAPAEGGETPAAPTTPVDGEETPATPTTPVEGEETPAAPTTPVDGGETPATPATPVDGEDEDEDNTPAPLLGAMPLGGDTPVVTAVTTESTTYLDENGETKSATATVVEASTTAVTWGAEGDTTWYVVNSDVAIDDTVTVEGSVNLILADGKTLTVTGKTPYMPTNELGSVYGIYVKATGSLTVYGQTGGTGKLTAKTVNTEIINVACPIYTSGISLHSETDNQKTGLTINGGTVTATGGDTKAGERSYGVAASNDVVINGGTLIGIGGKASGSGSNSCGFSGNVTLNSGTLIGQWDNSSPSGAAISKNGTLTLPTTCYWRKAADGAYSADEYVHDGNTPYMELTTQPSGYISYMAWDATKQKLTPTVIKESECSSVPTTEGEHPYIKWSGDAWYVVRGNVTISNRVEVTGQVNLILCDGATLTSGFIHIQNGGSLTIYGQSGQTGALTSEADSGAIHIEGGSLTINGGTVTATTTATEKEMHGIYSGALTINNGTVIAGGGSAINVTTLTLPATYWWRTAAGGTFTKSTNGTYTPDSETYAEITTTRPTGYTPTTVEYMDYNSKTGELEKKECEDPIRITGTTTTLGAEGTTTWYVVNESVTISGKLTTYGDVHLILCDDAVLTVNGGVVIKDTTPTDGDNSSLTIYGQSGKNGKLVANGSSTGNSVSAGIKNGSYGYLTINGGIIEATGGNTDGETPVPESYGIFGSYVVINSGLVTATGGAASNGEYPVSGGIYAFEMTVNGGEVEAIGGTATGTSGKRFGIEADLTITGGKVVARSNGSAVVFPTNATFTPPVAFWWRTSNEEGTKYNTQNTYSDSYLTGKYFELITTEPDNVNKTDTPVPYLDWDVDEEKLVLKTGNAACENYIKIRSGSSNVTWTAGWYVVDGTVTINGDVFIDGAVHLILCDNATLTVNGGIDAAMKEENSWDTLSVHGQSTGDNAGKMTVNSDAIRYDDDYRWSNGINLDEFYLYGGDVTAYGDDVSDNDRIVYSRGVNAWYVIVYGGSLTATGGDAESNDEAYSYGIYAEDALRVYGGVVKAYGGTTTGDGYSYSYGICGYYYTMTIENAEVTATGGDANGKGYTYSYGICAYDDLIIEDSTVTATGGTAESDDGDAKSCGIYAGIDMTIKGEETTVSATGGDAGAEGDVAYAYSYGIYVSEGNLSVCDAEVTAKGGTATGDEDAYSYGIYVDEYDLSVYDAKVTATGGDATATKDDAKSYGIYVGDGDMTIEGEDTTVTATGGKANGHYAKGYGIYVSDGMTIEDGTVTATAGDATSDYRAYSYGIYVSDGMTIEDGTVKATAGDTTGDNSRAYSYGIYVNDDLIIVDGTVKATGGNATGNEKKRSYGIYVDDLTIENGTVTAKTTATGSGVEKAAVYYDDSREMPDHYDNAWWWRTAVTELFRAHPDFYSEALDEDYFELVTTKPDIVYGEDIPDGDADRTDAAPIRRQNNAVAALVPSTDGKTDVTSPETFDAGIALYVGLGVLSLTGSAAWVGKRRKW